MVNKKGQEMSVTTLILIVMGVVLLVLLVLGFSMGWTNLWAKINIFQGGTTLDSAVQACKISVSSDASASFCEFKLVTIDGVKQYVNCQDSSIASKLDKNLGCSPDADKVFCQSLDQSVAKYQDTKVNSKTCKAILGVVTTTTNASEPKK